MCWMAKLMDKKTTNKLRAGWGAAEMERAEGMRSMKVRSS